MEVKTAIEILLLILFATFHGYFAAWLAVRMLFRPRKPVKILGFTIFPQGMIPRHRDRLAQAIGKAVGEELVSEETILKELFEKDFLRRKVYRSLKDNFENLSKSELPCLIESVPQKLRQPLLDTVFSFQSKISLYLTNSLRSEEVAASIDLFASRGIDQILSKRLSETIEENDFDYIVKFIQTKTFNSLKSPYFEKKIEEFVSYQIDNILSSQVNLEELLTHDSVELIKEKASEQIRPFIHQLAEIAASERTKNQIASIVKREVHNYYENLPFFKKIFVSRENLLKDIDSLVNNSLPKRIEEALSDDSFALEAKTFLVSAIDTAVKKPLKEILGNTSEENLRIIKKQVTSGVLKLLQNEETETSITSYLDELFAKIKPHSLDAILRVIHPESKEILKKQLSKTVLSVLRSEETSKIVEKVVSERVEKLLSEPIGRISDLISEEKIEEITKSLTEIIVDVAKNQLPTAIREFNIGEIVRQKINSYPAEKLEELVLSVAKEHLRTIELFGAIFGLIIGLIQSILSYFLFAKE